MIIKSISMQNFQCYFGGHERNTINFKQGLNLIIGNNGSGKSKLFDAFYWLLHDEIFESNSREFKSTKVYKEALISDKAKFESNIGDTVSTEVILIAKSTSSDKKFKITRIYKSLKIGEMEWEGIPSKLLIQEYKSADWRSVEESKHESVLKLVIPSHLKTYMWFQGEQVDDLMDFTNKSSLTKAINLLSNIKVYDEFIEISKKASEKSEQEYRKAQNRLTKDERKSKEYNIELDKIKKLIKDTSKDIIDCEESYQIAHENVEKLIGQIDDAQEQARLKEQKKQVESGLKNDAKKLDEKIKSLNNKIFEDSWVLKYSKPFTEKFSEKYSEYFKDHQEQELVANNKLVIGLDINTPKPVQVRNMLENEKCFVCDRDAKKGSEEYHYIESLLRRTDESNDQIFKQDCSNYFENLYGNALSFKNQISSIDARIKKEFDDIQKLKNGINTQKAEIEKITNTFEGLIDDDKSEDIVGAFKTHQTNKEKFNTLLNSDKNKLTQLQEKEKELDELLDKLVDGEIEESVVKAKLIFNNLKNISVTTREQVFESLINKIEERANSLFTKMAEKNNAITGQIKFHKIPNTNSKYVPEIVDSNGHKLSSPNDSNIVLVKLALLMSILLSHGKSSENYTMILDAPTTKMAFEYTHGFYKTLSNSFNQSIVMTYDFLTSEQREILKDFKIGSVHTITSNIPKHDNSDQNSLETIIKEIA